MQMRAVAETHGLNRNTIIGQLTRSPHGKLGEYLVVGSRAAAEEPEFLAHLIAWNQEKGQVRDSKVALPLIQVSSLRGLTGDADKVYSENALAHLCLLSPRDLVRALDFRKEHGLPGQTQLRKLVERYLRAREQHWPWWEKQAVQHRASMKNLYARHGIKPNAMADLVLFKGQAPSGTVFDRIKHLSEQSALEIASTIVKDRLPFLVLVGALGKRIKDEDVALAVIERMTATEIVTNTKLLEKLGVKEKPALRAAYAEALKRVAESKKAPSLKTTKAVEQQEDGAIKEKLRAVQQKQVDALQVEGNWLVLGDKSPSMHGAVVVARMVAGVLASMVKGRVELVFFDGVPRHFDVTGLGYEELCKKTQGVAAGGQGTSIGCGLAWALEKGVEVDGIAVVSDAQENTPPMFATVYGKACERWGKEPPVYLYRFAPGTRGYQDRDLADTMKAMGHEMQEFDLRGQTVDYYALPNVVQTMRTQRYGLADEILATPLKTVEEVLTRKVKGE